MPTTKQSQAQAILDVFDDHLRAGEKIVFGRNNTGWWARIGEASASHGVTLQDALAQVAQQLVCRPAVVLPDEMTVTLRSVREARHG